MKLIALAAIVVGVLGLGAQVGRRLHGTSPPPPCGPRLAIVVDSAAHRLWTCRDGKPAAVFPVRLGWGGLDKRREGDGRTPRGRYPLGAPRPSVRFGTFIPVGYPTPAQRAQGFSGGEIGVHGTRSSLSWLGDLTTVVDTTDGCIAVGPAEAIAEIARAVRAVPGAEIVVQ